MSQGPLCPNLTKKVQKEVSQMANRNLPCVMLIRWFKCKLKPPKNNNPLYADIEINEDWIRGWQDGDNDMYDGIFVDENDKPEASNHKQMPDINCNNVPLDNIDDSECDSNESVSDKTQQDNSNEIEKEDLIALEENCKLRDLPYDTCLQSKLPEEANQVFSIAPGEGNKPIPLLTDTLFEELTNPDKFPFGKGGFMDTERDTKLTLRKYVNARLLDQDGHFTKDLNTYLQCSMQLNISK